jgi:hypothetical protein
MQLVNAAVDAPRRAERAHAPPLKGQRYTFLRNLDDLTDAQLGFLAAEMQRSRTLKTTRAFHLKCVFQDLFAQPWRASGRSHQVVSVGDAQSAARDGERRPDDPHALGWGAPLVHLASQQRCA